MEQSRLSEQHYAAVDLGSNSFHLLIAAWRDDHLEVVDRYKEMVQIARGLDHNGKLSEATQTAALECLTRMGQRLRHIPASNIRAVGTKTLRAASNSIDFLHKATCALGHTIEIISGYEEARLVYQGVCAGQRNVDKKQLVIDIGGASTEIIIGINGTPILLESLNLGCVVLAERYFGNGASASAMQQAYTHACAAIEPIVHTYTNQGWDMAIGSSGTMRAAAELMDAKDRGIISRESLTRVIEETVANGEVINASVAKLRRDVLPAGLAIISALFNQLNLRELHVADGSLKEGLLYELAGGHSGTDTRERSIEQLINRYACDRAQGKRVANMASKLLAQLALPQIHQLAPTQLIEWAGKLHEIGLHISHSGYHKHGHYLLKHLDMGGFTRFEQHWLASLVRLQRNRIKHSLIIAQSQSLQPLMLIMVSVLRIALVFCRARKDPSVEPVLTANLHSEPLTLKLQLPTNWLNNNPLTYHNLQELAQELDPVGVNFSFH